MLPICLTALIASSSTAQACPRQVPSPDLDDNPRAEVSLSCDPDEILVGLLHKEYPSQYAYLQPWTDGVGIRCEDPAGVSRDLWVHNDVVHDGDEVLASCATGAITGYFADLVERWLYFNWSGQDTPHHIYGLSNELTVPR